MRKVEIIQSWYPELHLSKNEALEIYDHLLKLYLTLYHANKENKKEHNE